MTITSGLLPALAIFFALICGTDEVTDVLYCEVTDLAEYGFEQASEHDEYVCANQADFTYFRIIEDKDGIVEIGDEILLGLDQNGDVTRAIIK